MKLENKKILITGGTAGIGKAIAQALLREGAIVMIFSRSQKHVSNTLRDLKPFGEIHGLAADVSSNTDLEKIYNFVDDKFGWLDALINNAGLPARSIENMGLDEIDYVLAVNLGGTIKCTKLALNYLSSDGHIINIGSLSAKTRDAGSDIYVATKCGVEGFSESIRKQLIDQNIKVTLIEPGAVATNLHGLGELDLAKAVKEQTMLLPKTIADLIILILSQETNTHFSDVSIKAFKQNI